MKATKKPGLACFFPKPSSQRTCLDWACLRTGEAVYVLVGSWEALYGWAFSAGPQAGVDWAVLGLMVQPGPKQMPWRQQRHGKVSSAGRTPGSGATGPLGLSIGTLHPPTLLFSASGPWLPQIREVKPALSLPAAARARTKAAAARQPWQRSTHPSWAARAGAGPGTGARRAEPAARGARRGGP